MAKSVAVLDLTSAAFFTALTGQTCSSTSLSACTVRLQLGGMETYLMSCPQQLRAAHAMAALADIFLVCVGLEQFQSSDSTKKFTNLMARHFVVGIKIAVVCVNQPLSQQTFDEAAEQIRQICRKVGYQPSNSFVLPVSCESGCNILARSTAFGYYSGPCVCEVLGSVVLQPRPGGSLVFAVADRYSRQGAVVCCGRVLRGGVSVGDIVTLAPGRLKCPVLSIGYFGEVVNTANTGELCGLALGNVLKEDVMKGSVVSANEECGEVAAFEAQVIVLENQLRWGYEGTLYAHCAKVPVRVERINQLIDKRTGVVLEQMPATVSRGKAGCVRLVPKKPVVMTEFPKLQGCGRFFLSNSKLCEVVGVVRSVWKPESVGLD